MENIGRDIWKIGWDKGTHAGGGAAHIRSKNLLEYPRFLYKIQRFTVATQILQGW